MKRTTVTFLMILMIILNSFSCFGNMEGRLYDGAYTFRIDENGYAVITGCNDTSSEVIKIPQTVGGYPVGNVDGGAFSKCTALKALESDNPEFESVNGVLYIGSKLVCYPPAKKETAFTCPGDITEIGPCAFAGNDYITSVVLGDMIKAIPAECFAGCGSLKSVVAESITVIGDGAFVFCSMLSDINLPDCLDKIGSAAFYNCSSLKSFNLSDNITEIGTSAFDNCVSVYSIRIPAKITVVENWLFSINPGLKSVSVSDDNCLFFVKDNILYENTAEGTKLVYCPSGSEVSEPVISDNIIIIGSKAFENHKTMTKIVIPDSVSVIESHAFYNAGSLVEITLGAGLSSIGDYAFYGCMGFGDVKVLSSVTEIGKDAFGNCGYLRLLVAEGSAAHMYADSNNVNFAIDSTQQAVPAANWSDKYIRWAEKNGITHGVADYKASLNREGCSWLIMNFFENSAGEAPIPENPFFDTDLAPVLKAYGLGIINGVDSNHFEPSRPVTRQELCVCLVRLVTAINGKTPENGSLPGFKDDHLIADWARDYISIAYTNHIITGFPDGRINPTGSATIEEALVMLYNAANLID